MRLSASQLASFRDCRRKWAWQKIAGIQTPPNASASLGLEVHKQLETYLEGGSFDFTKEAGEIAASGVEHLPRPETLGMRCEEGFAFESPAGHEYMGYKDVEITCEEPIVIDHKTTSDLKWQKTEEQLRKDPQAVLYAVDAFRKNPHAKTVHLKWIYYQTRGTRKSRVTHLRVLPEDLLSPFQAIEEQANEMAAIYATVKNPLDLPPSIDHCSAYGGCPFQAHCNLSPFEKLRSIMSTSTPTNTPKPGGLLARLAAAKAPPITNGDTTVTRYDDKTPQGRVLAPTPESRVVNPPEYQPPPAPPPPVTDTATATPAPVTNAAPPPAEAPTKRGPGRPKKEAQAPQVEQVVLSTSDAKISVLFVDCAPNKPYTDASIFIQAAKLKLLAAGVADYRYADFGHGPGMLATAVADEIDKQLGPIGYVVVDHSPEGIVVLETLKSRSAMVVR